MKIQTDSKFIWRILLEAQAQKAFITMDKQQEINPLECLITAQPKQIRDIMEKTCLLKYNWV